jgi:hypothetical protein
VLTEPLGGFSANFLSVDPIVSKKRGFRVETKTEDYTRYGAVFDHFKSGEQEIAVLLGGLGVDSANMAQTSHECSRPANGSAGDDYEQRIH